jgi:hypothetical protein
MLYLLFRLALRPFRRWWRRLLVTAVIGTVVVPGARQVIQDAVTDHPKTIAVPNPR